MRRRFRIYLGGPIQGCTDHEARGWREEVKRRVKGDEFVDPMDRDYRGREAGNERAIVEADKADIGRCQVVLMNCPRPSVGTSMEIFYGWLTGRHVIVIAPDPVSPWLRYHSHELYSTLEQAIEALR